MTRNDIKAALTFFKEWRFRFSLVSVLSLYLTCMMTLCGGNWLINLSIKKKIEDGFDVTYSSADITIWTVVFAVVLTIGFIAGLIIIDRREIRKQSIVLSNEEKFKQIYIPFYTKIFEDIDMENYRYWAQSFAVDGVVKIRQDRYHRLLDLVDFCSQAQMIEGYEKHYSLIGNFRILLKDLLNVFDCHSELFGNDAYWFKQSHKDYRDMKRVYLEEEIFRQELLLIGDLTFELTRLLNYMLEEIRKYEVGLFAQYGNIAVVGAKDVNKNGNTPIVYTDEQKTDAPYPGLEAFLKVRETRNHHYSNSDIMLEDLRNNGVL